MAKNKKKKTNKKEEDIIIGYNSKPKKDNSPKKKEDKNKWKKIKKVLLFILKLIAIFGVFVIIGAFLFISPVFDITEIKVENANKISENSYIVLSNIQIGENIFSINKSKIRESIIAESYVESIDIKRELPGTIILTVQERTPKYMIEKNGGLYAYIDKNGYYLEASMESIDVPILRGLETDIETINLGDRLLDNDLDKFNDLIKITDAIKSNSIEQKITVIDMSDYDNYVLKFESEKKDVMLGDTSNLSTKMAWIKYFMQEKQSEEGTIYLNTDNIYFSPKR